MSIKFKDNSTRPDGLKSFFGDANDLAIYHDGSNSYINESGTGVLSIQSDGTEVQINKGASEYMARFITDGAVNLYHNNAKKFETTSTGVTVTGDVISNAIVQANGFRTTSGSTDYSLLTRNSSNTAVYIQQAGSGDILDVRYGSQAAGQGTSAFAVNSSGNATFAGNITFGDSHFIGDDGDDNLLIQSSANENIIIDSADDIILDAGGDDIRLKVNGTEYAKFDNASSNLNIFSTIQDKSIKFLGNDGGTQITALTLNMADGGDATFAGDVTATNILTVAGAATGSPYLQFTQGGSQKAYIQYADSGDSFELQSDNQFLVRTGGSTTALTINSSQNATFEGNVDLGDSSNITMAVGAPGQLQVKGSGYTGAVALDATAMYIYHDSALRDLVLGTNETARLTISGNSGNTAITGVVTAPTFSGDLNGTINTVTTAVTKANATNDTTVATTAFVQNLIGTIPAGLVFQGTWNASTNTPTLASGTGTTGYFYIVSASAEYNELRRRHRLAGR